jgi:dihydroxy-acid dehydratase
MNRLQPAGIHPQFKVAVSDEQLAQRRMQWKQPAHKATKATLGKFIKNVRTTSEGCVTDA